MRTFGIKTVIFLLVFCLAVPTVCAQVAESTVILSLEYGGNAYIGGEVIVKITLAKPSQALEGIEFILQYNKSGVAPVHTVNTEEGKEMDVLVSSMPEGWEQMSFHSESGYYHFRFAPQDSASSYLDEEGELVLEIPFTVIKAGSFDFVIDDADIVAVAADSASSLINGNGGKITLTAAAEAQKLQAELLGAERAFEDGKYNLKIKVTNLGDSEGIIAVQLELKYDKKAFAPIITANDSEQMNEFMTEMPQSNWEQMCSLDEIKGIYTLRIAAKTAESLTESERLLSGSSLVLTVPFNVIALEGSTAAFSVNGEYVRAMNNENTLLYGIGDSISVGIEKAQAGVIPEHLGYTVENGYLSHLSEKTDISEFLSELNGFFVTDSEGNQITKGYVCSGNILTDGINEYKIIVLGDVDRSGTTDTYDYILAARTYFGTFAPSELQLIAADVNGDGTVDQYDYILIKRHYFGTYVII